MLHLLDSVASGIKQRGLGHWLAQNVALEEIREPDFGFVFEVDGCWDGEDFCKLIVSICFAIGRERGGENVGVGDGAGATYDPIPPTSTA